MKQTFMWLFGIALLLLGAIYLITLNEATTPNGAAVPNDQADEDPKENQEEPTFTITSPADYRAIAKPDQGYVISIPYAVDVSNPQGLITRYRYVGPDSEPNTEITDGYTVTIETREAISDSLEEATSMSIQGTRSSLLEEPTEAEIAGIESRRYVTKSALGNKPITNHVLMPGNGYVYTIRINISPSDTTKYQDETDTILSTIQFFNDDVAQTLKQRVVQIAMLDYSATNQRDVASGTGASRGCDTVQIIDHVLESQTNSPIEAALTQLFQYDAEVVGGWQNFIASQTNSLTFDRVEVRDATAHIYLTGALGALGGVCDDPRAAIQIEETALANGVDAVQLYLDGEPTDLVPSARGEE